LEWEHTDGIIIANVNINSRQIDLIIALENKTIVVEIKGSHLPLVGKVNGDWHMLLANGEEKNIGNYYNQTLSAKHVIKDKMAVIAGIDLPPNRRIRPQLFRQHPRQTHHAQKQPR
jgi:hypothetical protein